MDNSPTPVYSKLFFEGLRRSLAQIKELIGPMESASSSILLVALIKMVEGYDEVIRLHGETEQGSREHAIGLECIEYFRMLEEEINRRFPTPPETP